MRLCLIVWRKGRLEGMDKYLYWLDNVLYLGDIAKRKLIDTFQTGEAIYRAEEKELKKILDDKKVGLLCNSRNVWDLDKKYEEVVHKGIYMVTSVEDSFPVNLQNISDPPFALYYKGRLPEEELPGVAVIGARQCSEYGRYIAQELGKCLGENNIQVISGMASGIDGISQYSASQAGGRSFGVLGCGVDVCYPKSNRRLYDELVNSGGILSSYPPGTQPLKQLFPPRNRIVSGLADVVIVNTCGFIESAKREAIDNILDIAWLKKNHTLNVIYNVSRKILILPTTNTDTSSDYIIVHTSPFINSLRFLSVLSPV